MEILLTPVRELWFDEEMYSGGYGCRVHPDYEDKVTLSDYGTITIKGICPRLGIGEEFRVTIKEEQNSKYKGTYIIEKISQDKPLTVDKQRIFLKSILSESQAENILTFYNNGEDIVGMIEDGSFDYASIKGLGEKTFEKLREKVLNNIELGELLIFLDKYKIKYNQISKLVKKYRNPQIVISKIEENPYLLTKEKGIGFETADAIAKALGYSMTSPLRIGSCVEYVISKENANGHSWIERRPLLNKCIELLRIDKSIIDEVIESCPDGIVCVNKRYSKKSIYDAEDYIARRLFTFKMQSKELFSKEHVDKFIEDYSSENNVELEENQKKFFYDFNSRNISFLVGGGGMGKSWLVQILTKFIQPKNLRIALLAPTGKASKVLGNYVKMEASTIHRKIRSFDEDEEAEGEIWEDVIIVDESSMCDVIIMQKLLLAIKNPAAKIIFIGDDFQLPSVGVGNFLYDSLNCGVLEISKLKKVFRQADGGILNVSTDIREGKPFLSDADEGRKVFGKDCVFWLTHSDYVRDGVLTNFKKVADKFDQTEIAVLTPTKKGKLGTVSLNKDLQKIANPKSTKKKEKIIGKKDQIIFRVGDLVMNTTNTYDMETVDGKSVDVFNGDTGIIIDIDEEAKAFVIDFDGFKVKFKFSTILNYIVHAWAITIHKSQGSQYKVTIVIADHSMSYQLNANLLYTAMSRAKQFMLVLGQAKTINAAMKKFANMERRSFLQERYAEYAGTYQPKPEIVSRETIEEKPRETVSEDFVYEDFD